MKDKIMSMQAQLIKLGYNKAVALKIAHNWQRFHDLDFVMCLINALGVDHEIFSTWMKNERR